MKAKAKIAILLVAVMITLVGFNLIASTSALGMSQLGQTRGFHVDVVVTAKLGSDAPAVVHFNGLT
jgi:hypothetical protein